MRGASIGVPLTIMQFSAHHHTGASIDAALIANNFILGYGIYGGDRIDAQWWQPDRYKTSLATIASSAFFVPYFFPLSILSLCLGLQYDTIKRSIARLKPFFVSLMWTIAVYYFPLLYTASPQTGLFLWEPFVPSSIFLSIAALSHGADIIDIEEDRANGILTPAVLMEKKEATHYMLCLMFAGFLLHSLSPGFVISYDIACLSAITGLYFETVEISILVGISFAVLWVRDNIDTIAAKLLVSTEMTHKVTIEVLVDAVRCSDALPDNVRFLFLNLIVHVAELGDKVGSHILLLYLHSILRSL